ncbi:rod shape-determining protein MreD [Aquipluma nitroreducens]|uniref:Rod shape-determining protein MreD n=1 Tax=Aquipluma nitroreducens TaxID=2010828 RepID=A0A5K7SCK1_9BACT|nr:rod shape-determining protein MreD [Aquipluma nitroreducens]BBE19331.1 rod shape-determining protein MreD [Aquipluma nitroreducens]
MIKDLGKYVIMFFVLVLVQVLILNNIQFSGLVNPYIYILFILLLPFTIPGYFLLGISFILGISIDIFGNTPGIHAGATVLLGFLRPGIAQLVSSRELIEKGTMPSMAQLGFASFIKYTVISVLIHHLFLFFAEAFSFSDFFETLLRWILSSIFSIIIILGSQFIVFKN